MWGTFSGRTSGFLGILVLFAALAGGRANAQQPLPDWEGWYAGGLLGYAWTHVNIAMPPVSSSDTYEGVTGGIMGGFNAQLSDTTIVGFEADITFADLMGGMSLARHKVSLVGRVGYLPTPTLLLFAVAGIAGGQYEAKVSATGTSITFVFDDESETLIPVATTTTQPVERDKRLWGFTVGGGFETELNGFSFPARLGLEYRYTDFETWNFVALGQAFSIDPQVHEIRARFIVPIN